MAKEKTNPITGYDLTLMPGEPDGLSIFGWIRLANGPQDAGYIYLQMPPVVPRLNSTETYIVTSIAPEMLPTMLDILRNERNLQIRFFDSQAGNPPSVFIESASFTSTTSVLKSATDIDILGEVSTFLGKQAN